MQVTPGKQAVRHAGTNKKARQTLHKSHHALLTLGIERNCKNSIKEKEKKQKKRKKESSKWEATQGGRNQARELYRQDAM